MVALQVAQNRKEPLVGSGSCVPQVKQMMREVSVSVSRRLDRVSSMSSKHMPSPHAASLEVGKEARRRRLLVACSDIGLDVVPVEGRFFTRFADIGRRSRVFAGRGVPARAASPAGTEAAGEYREGVRNVLPVLMRSGGGRRNPINDEVVSIRASSFERGRGWGRTRCV